ncbi:hypothetical protein R1T08_03355 [Streptomyces sp. SBC-4]|nr:hypothetical protein [Streptomyces sp. SBC-4]MDV5143361.1 hypothetical protein [Streptomyces sp. SBC-4]
MRGAIGRRLFFRAGTDIETVEYADGRVVTLPTRALAFGYPLWTRPVGVHLKPWGWRRSCRCPRPNCVTGR